MKILFITHNFHPRIGGIEVNSEILASAFSEYGHQVRLVTWTPDPENTSFAFPVYRNPGMWKLLELHRWASLVFENNPSLRLSWPSLLFANINVIAVRTWISRSDGTTGIQDILKRYWLKRAERVIAVSEAVRRKCCPEAVVIGNPYRAGQFKILPEIDRSIDFVFLGRLVSDKGADQAILGMYQLNKSGMQKYHLSIVGDGPEKKYLEGLASDLELSELVHFTGALQGEELIRTLNRHRILLVPSLWEEPFGNVALEGMACGCIPIVSDGGGLPDAVGKAGLCFERGNLKMLVSTMKRVIKDSSLQKQLLQEAKTHLRAHHPETITKKYLEIVENAPTAPKKVFT